MELRFMNCTDRRYSARIQDCKQTKCSFFPLHFHRNSFCENLEVEVLKLIFNFTENKACRQSQLGGSCLHNHDEIRIRDDYK